ncbi:MAG: hypothetical protein KBD43_00280 [Saprospiraceae bacterium]|nr:hypothetical protein [Candidatus Brachybacter algidus]MBP9844463.1 hypothetical protein [Saprospiraceae bacterium]
MNLEFDDSIESESPWLFKILLTCFPTQLNDTVYDLKNNETKELLKKSEVINLVKFIKYLLVQNNFDIKDFSRGSLFYIKLGKNKSQKIKDDLQKLEKGIQYTLNFLQHSTKNRPFSKIFLQSDVLEVSKLNTEIIEIDSTNEIYRQIIDYNSTTPIQIIFGYESNPQNEVLKKKTSNFFKFFPMEKEAVGFNFIIHSDAFIIEKSRRELQGDSRNNLLLNYLISELKVKLSDYRVNNIEKYRQIFLSIYLSKKPEQTPEHFSNLYQDLVSITKDFIPNDEDGVSSSIEIVAKNENVNISFKLSDWGIKKKFFHWQGEGNKNLLYITVLKEYKIEKWDLITCISNADEVSFNNWFVRLSANSQSEFLAELEVSDLKAVSKLSLLKLFRFSDNEFYSANDDASKIDGADSEEKPQNLVFHSTTTFKIKSELEKLEHVTSEIDIEKTYPKLFQSLGLNLKQPDLFNEVRAKSLIIELDSHEKKNVFQTFSSQPIPQLQSEKYFKNSFGFESLSNLLKPNKEYPAWLRKFSILESEYYPELDSFLIKDDVQIFSFIYGNWASIITLEEVKKDVKAFYNKVETYKILSSNPTLSYTNLSIVFVNETIGFQNSSAVYFHKTLSDCQFEKIKNAIKTIFDMEIPSKNALEFLSKEGGVFRISDNDNLLTRTLTSKTPIELTKEDVIEFVNFSISKIHEEFFKHFIISVKEKEIYLIEQRTSEIFQVNKIRKEVVELIKSTESLKAKYKILPYALKDSFRETKEILTQQNGFSSLLLKDKELLTKPTEIFKYLSDSTSQKEYISEQSEILIPINTEIDIESSVYKILEWCLGTGEHKGVFTIEEIPLVRNKFKLQVGEKKIEVAKSKGEITIGNKVFSLADLIPNNIVDIRNEYTSHFLKQYSKVANEIKLKSFFGIEEDIMPQEVYDSILDYNTNPLNTRQVEFLLIYSVESSSVDLTSFAVETISEKQNLSNLFYKKFISFIKPTQILHEKYADIEIQYCKSTILSEYKLSDKGELDTSFFKEELNDAEKISLLEFVFDVWKADKEKFAALNIDSIYNFLGFQKNERFLKDDYTVANEKLPSFFKTFLAEDAEKITFSIVIGINNKDNSAIELRKYFENNTPEKLFEDIQNISSKLLHNTLQWLQEKGIVLSKVFHLEALKIIYAQIIPTDNTPFLFIDSFDTESNLCYKIKQAETDNYLIGDSELAKLNDYEIPLEKIFKLHEESSKNLVNQSSYPPSFVFNESFKQLQIPDAIISIAELQNLEEWKEQYFIEWKKINEKSILVYLFDGEIPRHISFENENISLERKGYEFESDGFYYISKDADNVLKSLKKILPQDLYEGLAIFKSEYEQPKPEDENSLAKSFYDEVNEFLNDFESDIENRYSSEIIAELKNMALGLYNESNITAMMNLIVKLKVCKKLKIDYSKNWGYNYVESKGTKYIVFSARRAFAYIHPAKIIELRDNNSKILIDFGKNLELVEFNSLEELFRYNTDHLFFYSGERTPAELEALCEQNQSRSGFRLLLVDKNKEISELTALFQITNRETYD